MTQCVGATPLVRDPLVTGSVNDKKLFFAPRRETEIFYVYGVGLPIQSTAKWLRRDRCHQLIFIEDERERLDCFSQTIEAIRLLEDPQVKLVFLQKESLEEAIGEGLYRPFEFLTMPGKNRLFASHFLDLKMNVEHKASLYREYGASHAQNILKNGTLPALDGHALKGKLKNVPAIICGAGPSLDKNIDVLKTVGNKAAVFAGGSALQLLIEERVSLDFGGSIDPHPPEQSFPLLHCPLFFQNQTAPSLLSRAKGPLIRMGPSGGLCLERWLTPDLPLFDAGTHVAAFLTHVAQFLGCTPIIFVGMDGCYSKSQIYFGQRRDCQIRESLTVVDRFGHTVLSCPDFLLGRRFLEHFAKTHPQTVFLNATEGGLSMKGIANRTLRSVKDQYLFEPLDLSHLLKGALPRVLSLKSTALLNSFVKCQKICKDPSLFFNRDLSQEVFYQFVLVPNWEVWRCFLQRRDMVEAMADPSFEKWVQRFIFFRTICEHYGRFLST